MITEQQIEYQDVNIKLKLTMTRQEASQMWHLLSAALSSQDLDAFVQQYSDQKDGVLPYIPGQGFIQELFTAVDQAFDSI